MTPVESLFSNVPQLPSIPTVVQALIASLGDDNADIGSMVARIKQDQSLCARVLRLANSSYYGSHRKVGAIDDAVTLIGLSALRTLVIASGVTGAFTRVPGVNLKDFWQHSMFTAVLARDLGKQAGLNGEFAYTAGLMHGIGQLLIDMAYPSAAKEIGSDQHPMTVTELAAAERHLLNLDHAEVGAELALRWNFPAIIRNALRWYITPLDEQACPYAGTVHLAAQIASGMTLDQPHEQIAAQVNQELARKLVLDHLNWVDFVATASEMLQGEVVLE